MNSARKTNIKQDRRVSRLGTTVPIKTRLKPNFGFSKMFARVLRIFASVCANYYGTYGIRFLMNIVFDTFFSSETCNSVKAKQIDSGTNA